MKFPDVLMSSSDSSAVALLKDYYGEKVGGTPTRSGAAFDTWDSTGTRQQDRDRLTADDLVAITLLSVHLSGDAARRLLVDEADRYTRLLTAVDSDCDLVDVEEPFAADGPEWTLNAALLELPGVGPTKASKLLARKRPRLRPIYDSVVAEVLGTRDHHWEPVRSALRRDGGALHRRLLSLRRQAGLPEAVSPLRVLDVLAWMEGKRAGLQPTPDPEELVD